MSLCLVTCGPASTRIDDVRRITNFSTGEMGTLLSETLASAGHQVICLRGEGATFPPPQQGETRSFFSNDDLLAHFEQLARGPVVHHIFHAAALTDFEVADVCDSSGKPLTTGKISSAHQSLIVHLQPALKILPRLRTLFPHAFITGWKYELEGTPADALQKSHLQLQHADACVLNGRAFGPGFARITTADRHDFSEKTVLADFLAQFAADRSLPVRTTCD